MAANRGRLTNRQRGDTADANVNILAQSTSLQNVFDIETRITGQKG